MEYLEELEKMGIDPNFWCSKEYFKKAGFIAHKENDVIWVEENSLVVFPAINLKNKKLEVLQDRGTWCDFNNNAFPELTKTFLDYEYIYNPEDFKKLSGKKWKTFRKNMGKWKGMGVYKKLSLNDKEAVKNLLLVWLSQRINKPIHDDQMLLSFVFYGENRFGFFKDGILLGINVWDSNWKYINFRYCICEPFLGLSEYLRYLFFTVNAKSKLVNDGGVLDTPSLKFFKDRLNPIQIRNVYSWR